MQVTSALKRRFTVSTMISQSYSGALEQTFKFPLRSEERLALLCEKNRLVSGDFLKRLKGATEITDFGPLWADVSASEVVLFLRSFYVDPEVGGLSPELMAAWIEQQNIDGDLVNWTVVVRGRESENKKLGRANWLPDGMKSVWNLGRTRIAGSNSLGVITTPGDEEFGLTDEELQIAQSKLKTGEVKDRNTAARRTRRSSCALLLLYPISRYSGHDGSPPGRSREPIYADPDGPSARDLIGMAVSFPATKKVRPAEAYLEGTSRWRPVL
jgi:hypothetical protein